jgi:hypothetical protein
MTTIEQIVGAFRLLWGEAPPDSLKGRKGAEIESFLRQKLGGLIEEMAGEVSKRTMNGQDEWGSGFDNGIDTATQIIRSYKQKV